MPFPPSEPIMQVGYVVTDLDAAIRQWIDHSGIGPWTVFRGVSLQGRYRDEDTTVTMEVAMGYSGNVQIELMQITSASPSPYVDNDGRALVGPHHVAWITDDLDETLAAARESGLDVLFFGEGPSTKVAYLTSPASPGVIFEYIQTDGMREMVAHGIEQSRGWDGADPIRVSG